MLSVGALGIVPIGITALIALGGCGNGDDGGPSAEPLAALRPTDQSAFDSSEHPDLGELSAVVAGLFLPDSGLALVERNEIHLIDLSSGGTRVVGREGEDRGSSAISGARDAFRAGSWSRTCLVVVCR